MDKPRRRAQHLQLVHSEPASQAAPPPPPRRKLSVNRAAMAMGVLALGLLVWTRSSDMPEHTPIAAASPGPQQIAQSFPAAPAASTRHVSAVLAFDAALVGAADDKPDAARFLEAGARVAPLARVMFRLYNRSPQSAYFVLFGVDAKNTFTWFYPPDRTGGVDRSLPLAAVPSVALPEPMTLPAQVDNLTLVGVFTDAPVTIEEIKQTWQTSGAMGLQGTLHAQVQTLLLNPHQP